MTHAKKEDMVSTKVLKVSPDDRKGIIDYLKHLKFAGNILRITESSHELQEMVKLSRLKNKNKTSTLNQ